MRSAYRLPLLWLFFFLRFSAIAQTGLAIGQWQAYLPYTYGAYVTQSQDFVYYGTEAAVLVIDKTDLSTSYLTRVNGLSQVDIRGIQYSESSRTLVVSYANTVIDLIRPDGIVTLNQIRNFSNIAGTKTINRIHATRDEQLLLATSYGVSVIHIPSASFAFTTFMPVAVKDVVVFNNQLFAATSQGIYTIDKNADFIEDFRNWRLLGPSAGLPASYSSASLTIFQNQLYLEADNLLYAFDGNDAIPLFTPDPGLTLIYLSADGPDMLVGLSCSSTNCSTDVVLAFNATGNFRRLDPGCVGQPNYAIQEASGRIWLGDFFRNFRYLNSPESSCQTIAINAPISRNLREIAVYNNQLWITSGGVNATFSNRFIGDGFASLIDGSWTIYNRETKNEIKGVSLEDPADDLLDFITVAIHPGNGTVYAGSFYEGLIEFKDPEMNLYNDANSSLQNAVGDEARTRVSGLAFDDDNNLWVSNHAAPKPLSVLTPDGKWQSFNLNCGRTLIHQLDVDDNGFIWIVDGSSQGGITVFDPGDLDNPADDRCRSFTETNSTLPTNNTNCLAVDLEGDVWVGTTQGIVIFECGSSAFEDICNGSRRVIEQDGFGAYLLETENVQTIAIDGANRKWIGTTNGVFVLSPDGEQQVTRFTTENSPLLDNNVIDIAIHPQTGEVFIATNSGLISIQSDAVAGQRVHANPIQIFPNPVRPDYEGPIAIRGLTRDANVKITTPAGQLVYETRTLGGQAIWDGRDYNGNSVGSGVYLVFSSDSTQRFGVSVKPDAAVAKIVFIR